MQHECTGILAFQRINPLLIIRRPKRHNGQALGFSASKDG